MGVNPTWAEAEAALPEGWQVAALERRGADSWEAITESTPEHDLEYAHVEWAGEGPTPAAALRKLARKLRQEDDEE